MGFTILILFQRCFFLLHSLSFFHRLLPRSPHPTFIFILPPPFFPPPACPTLPSCPQPPSPLSLCLSASPCYFSLPPSLCITLSQPNGITGEHASLSSFALSTISSLIAVKLMKWSARMTPSFDRFLTYSIFIQSSQPPLFLNIFILVSLLYLPPDFESLFLCFMPQKTV